MSVHELGSTHRDESVTKRQKKYTITVENDATFYDTSVILRRFTSYTYVALYSYRACSHFNPDDKIAIN